MFKPIQVHRPQRHRRRSTCSWSQFWIYLHFTTLSILTAYSHRGSWGLHLIAYIIQCTGQWRKCYWTTIKDLCLSAAWSLLAPGIIQIRLNPGAAEHCRCADQTGSINFTSSVVRPHLDPHLSHAIWMGAHIYITRTTKPAWHRPTHAYLLRNICSFPFGTILFTWNIISSLISFRKHFTNWIKWHIIYFQPFRTIIFLTSDIRYIDWLPQSFGTNFICWSNSAIQYIEIYIIVRKGKLCRWMYTSVNTFNPSAPLFFIFRHSIHRSTTPTLPQKFYFLI